MAQKEEHEAFVERDARGRLCIGWAQAPDAHVYAGVHPERIDRGEPVARLQAGHVKLDAPPAGSRRFYELVGPDGGPSRVVAERLLSFEGASNFRDLGGYPTQDGGRVRWGHIFRSDHLADLSEPDLGFMNELGIRLVVDFRSQEEIESQPNRLPAGSPTRQINPAIQGTALMPGAIREAIMTGNPDGLDFRTLLLDGNRSMAKHARDQFRTLFDHLEQDDHVPLLFHCTAGKDRTGLAAALILVALGVSEEVAMEDYLLTAVYTHDTIERTLTTMRVMQGFQLDLDEVRPMMSVRREFLQSAFDGIHDEFGSFDRYFEQALGVTAARREALRARLVI